MFNVIIPARAGSKRLPGKNMMELCGKPLIYYTISAALEASYVDEILVSTDDPEIICFVEKLRNIKLFKRGGETGSDNASSFDVISECAHVFSKSLQIIYLQPTSPLRTTEDINNACKMAVSGNPVVSVTEQEHPSAWIFSDDVKLSNCTIQRITTKRSQDHKKEFRLNGAIYISALEDIKKYKSHLTPGALLYHMPHVRSVDIDTFEDFRYAEFILKERSHDHS